MGFFRMTMGDCLRRMYILAQEGSQPPEEVVCVLAVSLSLTHVALESKVALILN